ncbi:hypothetical protein B0H14DRAFT_2615812 [Mycena olivaceomarginata]|nr:hypothetical protein B0H14DRAFT_2615812 [Mycena olivaceomarginata]
MSSGDCRGQFDRSQGDYQSQLYRICIKAPSVPKPRAAAKARAVAKPNPARKRQSRGNKENEDGLGRRDDEVTCAAVERLRRHTKGRAIIEDEDDEDAPPGDGNLSGTPTSINPDAGPSNAALDAHSDAAHVPALSVTMPDPFLHLIDPMWIYLSNVLQGRAAPYEGGRATSRDVDGGDGSRVTDCPEWYCRVVPNLAGNTLEVPCWTFTGGFYGRMEGEAEAETPLLADHDVIWSTGWLPYQGKAGGFGHHQAVIEYDQHHFLTG